jgi:polysaccharide biosynthesis/export protein
VVREIAAAIALEMTLSEALMKDLSTRRRTLPASVALLALALASTACAPRLPSYDYSKEPDPRRREYVLGVSDALSITVWKSPELSTQATVRPDGTITMPLVGDLVADGRTPSQLKNEIETRLSAFMNLEGTEITVAVTGVNSYRFTVSGEVTRPGIYTANHYVTVAEAIALAGGFTRFAARDDVVIMRRDRDSGEVRQIPIVYTLLAKGQHPEMNLVVIAGDSIHVP